VLLHYDTQLALAINLGVCVKESHDALNHKRHVIDGPIRKYCI